MMRWIIAAALVALPLEVSAASTRYDCTFLTGSKRDGNWVPSLLVLQHDDRSGEVVVFDPLIKHFVGKPINGRLADQTRARTSFAWEIDTSVKGGAAGAQSAKMRYKLSYFNNGQPARVYATPSGYNNEFSAEGSCTLKKG